MPLIGGIFYILTQMVQKNEVDKLQRDLTAVINPTKKITDLRAQLDFADTFQNRVNLADALLEQGNYSEAVGHYRDALSGNFSNDVHVKMQLIRAYQAQGETDWIIQEAESIKEHPEFLKSPVVLYYALALDAKGDSEAAQPYFESIDKRYSNYAERVQLARHYIDKAEEERLLPYLMKYSQRPLLWVKTAGDSIVLLSEKLKNFDNPFNVSTQTPVSSLFSQRCHQNDSGHLTATAIQYR